MKFNVNGLTRTAPEEKSGWLYTLGIIFFLVCVACCYDCVINFHLAKKFKNLTDGGKYRGTILFFCTWLMFQRFLLTFIPTVPNLYVIYLFHQTLPLYLQFTILKRSKSILYTQISKQEQDMEYQQMNTSEEDLY